MPSSPPPLSPSASIAAMDTPPLSTPRTPRASHYARSPHSHRRVRAFPRQQLWTWQGDRTSAGGLDTAIRPDAIENVLREAALTTLLNVPPAIVSGTTGGPSLTRAATVLSPINHHSHLHHAHSPLQHQATPPTPLSSSSMSSPSSGGSSHSLLQLHTGSRRRLGKKETPQPSLRVSSRNLVSPASSSSGGREVDGWKTYKLAHRTNRLMVKTKRLMEVLHRSGSSIRKTKASRGGGEDTDDEFGGESGGTSVDDPEADVEQEMMEDSEARENERIVIEQLQRKEMFEREVCLDNEDDFQDGDFMGSKSLETRQSLGTLDQSSSNHSVPNDVSGDEFWKTYKSVHKNKQTHTARGQYITSCEAKSLLVLPVLDLQRPSRYNPQTKTLRYDNYYFGDDRAESFGGSLRLLPVSVNHLSMKNVGVTSPGSAAIVNGLKLRELQHLNFSENRIGPKGATAIFRGLRDPQVNLKTLNLGNNQLGDQIVLVLMQCLVNRCTLEHLDLHKNHIYHSAKAIGELLRITTPLRSLNLAWNNIRGEPAQYLAKCMMENLTLTSLDLSDNTLGNNGNADAELGACLATNKSLRSLDVSNNHIHGKSVLVYVNGLQQNTTLETLTIRCNPIGNLGTEAILRSVASGAIAKCEIDIGDCNVEIQDTSQQTVIYGGGMYSLNVAERADTILLKELLLLSWKNKTEISDALWNGMPYTFNRKDEKSFVHTFPSSGILQLKVQPNYDRHEEMITHGGLVRIERLLKRSFGAGRDGDEAAKLLCIKLLAEEYSFNVDHANALLALFQTHTSQVEKASAAAVLIPQICGVKAASSSSACTRDELYDCAAMEIPHEFFEDKDHDGKIDVCGDICMVIGLKNLSDVEQAHVEKRVGKWISFNVANPTGRYRLNMSNPVDRRILMRILETNRVEKKLRQHYKLADTSQHGLTSQPLQGGFRNMRLNHLPVIMDTTWQFPRLGVLEFDFVQTKRPYTICTALSDAAFEKFLREFKQLDVTADIKLIGLRSISTCYYFNCSHVQRLMEHFGTFERDPETGILYRAEVIVILFSRIVDEWNLSEALSLLDLATKHQVFERLGHLNCFHALQVAETYGPLQLTVFDHRQLILMLVKLASCGEIDLTNVVVDNEMVEPDEWKTWTGEDKLPAAGVLSCFMRAVHGMQSESQLPATSVRKKMIQTLLLKLENRAQENIA